MDKDKTMNSEITEQDLHNRGKANIRLAILLGLMAVGFFAAGIYMAINKAAG